MVFVQPLDLQNLLVWTLSGSWTIFLFIALIFIVVMAARFRMNNITMIMMLGLFSILMANWISWFYIFMIICISIIVSFMIAKIIKN